jgi:hypothetical protein
LNHLLVLVELDEVRRDRLNFLTDDGRFTATELATYPVNAHKGLETYLKNEAGDRGAPTLERLRSRKKPPATKQPQLPGFDRTGVELALEQIATERERIAALEERAETLFDAQDAQTAFEELEAADDSVRNRLRRAADFWCAQWFSIGEDARSDDRGPVVPATFGQFDEAISALVNGAAIPQRLTSLTESSAVVATRRRFFHWVLEFPEVLLDRHGFDAVLGNPPWNTTTPRDTEFFSTYDPEVFRKGVREAEKDLRKTQLRNDVGIDGLWRNEARYLYELSNYARPESGRFDWYAEEDGQLRKGDANVFRLFVERAYRLLRSGGRLGQVLPDSVYVSSPATSVRQHLLQDGLLDRCWVFENRKRIFPIHRSVKVVMMVAQRGGGPTVRFKAAFLAGRNSDGRERAVGLDALPEVLRSLDEESPMQRDRVLRSTSARRVASAAIDRGSESHGRFRRALWHPSDTRSLLLYGTAPSSRYASIRLSRSRYSGRGSGRPDPISRISFAMSGNDRPDRGAVAEDSHLSGTELLSRGGAGGTLQLAVCTAQSWSRGMESEERLRVGCMVEVDTETPHAVSRVFDQPLGERCSSPW